MGHLPLSRNRERVKGNTMWNINAAWNTKETWAPGRKRERCPMSPSAQHVREYADYCCAHCGRRLCDCPREAAFHECSLVLKVADEHNQRLQEGKA
jgi:hypothetical protein